MTEKLTKAEVARRQLGTALALFLKDGDPVSVHTLACAGCEVAEHLTRKTGAAPFSSHALATFPQLDIGHLKRVQNQYWNAFKHATTRLGKERADEELLAKFDDEINDHILFIGWYDYMLATNQLPVEAQAFHIWYFALHPDKLAPDVDKSQYLSVFPKLHGRTRREQKAALRRKIAWARKDRRTMKDKRTDGRPLIISVESKSSRPRHKRRCSRA